jgi:uncharacterized membrane protein YfcA
MTDKSTRLAPWPALLGLGFITDFLDTLGVGSFATTSTALKLGRVVEDDEIPGTMNIGHCLPTMLEAAIFIGVIGVEKFTLVSMIVAGALGAWFGTGFVVRWPKLAIQRGMAIALIVTAAFIALRTSGVFPGGGDALALTGIALVVGIVVNFFIGSITSLGIGNYAPCMALVSLLGMDPKAAFPIMMGSAALILPAAAIRFFKSGRFHKRTALALTIGGIPGVLVAAFIVKELPLDVVKWLVVVVLVYTSALMWISAKAEARRLAQAQPAPSAALT